MRIPSDKPTFTEAPDASRTRDKASVDATARSGESARAETEAARPSEAAIPSASLDQAVMDTDMAAREFEKTISARLDQVRQQLLSGNYAIDYERLAQRMMEDGFGS